MSQAHLFGTHDGIFSTFAYVQRQECHHRNLRGAFIREGRLIERGVYRIFLGLYWAFKREWAFIRENAVLEMFFIEILTDKMNCN